ncbi:conserved Plasmodium protein, unknown function [Babesia microti strain RI]|uniref:Uncharacterized protein n=1 Tax=Babesia microti (strain RI) TaxID=1133968 RepID=A0A1N6LWK4_BABMR|nr:conserved Plasmodium protein, unknown function [Babesia microti strain RI]SIO73254.1 conserved Plasmodium protein, unknown function [Babesia microti strain RI]|eukprot:XP_012647300.2 conserved Plasmodium protein, unknown function [Babesia microti strain RI]
MGVEKPKGGLGKVEKKPKPPSATKKSTEPNSNNTSDNAKIPIHADQKVDSSSSNAQKSNKSPKLNGQAHGEKLVTKHGNNGIDKKKHEHPLSTKSETYSKSKISDKLYSGSGNVDTSTSTNAANKRSDRSYKDDKKMANNGYGRKMKSNAKLNSDISSKSNLSNDTDHSNLHTSKNHDEKSTNSHSETTVRNIINLDSVPDISKLSPRSKEWVGNLFPVLECYNFTLPEILMLIKRNEYNADKIQNAVSVIMQVQGGHEQGQWQTVGVKPPKPKEQDKAKMYHDKVNNYLKALRAQNNENNKSKQQQQQLKHDDDKNMKFQKNGKKDVEGYHVTAKTKESEAVSRNRDEKPYKKDAPDKASNKSFSVSRDKLLGPTRSVCDKSSGISVGDDKAATDQNDSVSKLDNASEVDIPKLFDLSLKSKGAKIDKNSRYNRSDGKLGKNYRDKIFNSGTTDHSDKIENSKTMESTEILQAGTTTTHTTTYGLQQFRDVNFQTQKYQYQDYQGKSYANYPHYAHYGYPEYAQQPMPTFQPYQDPAIIASYPNFKNYQAVMPNMPKYNPNNLPMMIPTNYSSGVPNSSPTDINGSDNLRNTIPSRDLSNDKLLSDDNIGGTNSQKNKIVANNLNDDSLWREQVKNIPQSVNWKDQSDKDQKKVPASSASGRDMPIVNSQGHGYNGNYSIPPGLHSTSYPYSYSSYPYNPNYSGMMYGTQNPQMHSHHIMSYNQYDSSYKYVGGPPGLDARGSHENGDKLAQREQMNVGYNKVQSSSSSYGKSPHEGIPNPPGLASYYSQYQPSYGNHSGSYPNGSNWP